MLLPRSFAIKMRAHSFITTALLATQGGLGARILQGNDDGWAELYLRSFNDALNAAGHDVVLSAPADNKSGTGGFNSTVAGAELALSKSVRR